MTRLLPGRAALVAVAAFVVATEALAAPATPATSAAPAARTLEDQFGRAVEPRLGAGRPVVVIASAVRAAAEEISAWDEALAALPFGVDAYRIADLKALPFFVPRGAVIKDLKEKYAGMPLLLDWKGEVSAFLRAPKKATAVLVFGPDGVELGRVEGAASASGALAIKALLAGRK